MEKKKRKIYYHGSKERFTELRRNKPRNSDTEYALEGLSAIYLTNKWDFALFMGAKPRKGGATIAYKKNIEKPKKPIYFEYLEELDLEEYIYIYSIDISEIPDCKIIRVDEIQIAVNLDVIKFREDTKIERIKVRDIFKYFYIDESLKERFR